MKTIVKSYIYRDATYTIVLKDNHYCAINNEYLDERGCLTVGLNGLQMHAAQTLDECIGNVNRAEDLRYYIEQGMSKAEAFCKVHGIELNSKVEAILNNIDKITA